MKQNLLVSFFRYLLLLFIAICTILSARETLALEIEVMAGEYVIERKTSFARRAGTKSVFPRFELRHKQKARSARALRKSRKIEKFNQQQAQNDCAEILQDPSIASCEPNYIRRLSRVPNDKGFDQQLGFMDRDGKVDINAPEAWNYTTGSSDQVVAIIDSGINYHHPDLIPNLFVNPNEIPNNGIDDDQNGYVDDVYGADSHAVSGDPIDRDGHGTHVAGIIAAAGNNKIGISGVSWHGQILSVKATNEEGILDSLSIARAIRYIVEMKERFGLKITVNASYGGGGKSDLEKAAIEYLEAHGIIFVNAAGNFDQNNDLNAYYPGNYKTSNMLVVGSVDRYGRMSLFSNYGKHAVDLVAPGENILSTFASDDDSDPEWYAYMDGTSMAAPHVTGALLLLSSFREDLSHEEKIQMLLGSARKLPSLRGWVHSGAILDVENMLRIAQHAGLEPDEISQANLDNEGEARVPVVSRIALLVRRIAIAISIIRRSEREKLSHAAGRPQSIRSVHSAKLNKAQKNIQNSLKKLLQIQRKHPNVQEVLPNYSRKKLQQIHRSIAIAQSTKGSPDAVQAAWKKARKQIGKLFSSNL